MAATITVEVVKPMMFDGRHVPRSATLKLDALTAQHLLDSGRVRLVHADDAELCRAALRDDVRRALREAGRPWHQPQPQEPWQRVL